MDVAEVSLQTVVTNMFSSVINIQLGLPDLEILPRSRRRERRRGNLAARGARTATRPAPTADGAALWRSRVSPAPDLLDTPLHQGDAAFAFAFAFGAAAFASVFLPTVTTLLSNRAGARRRALRRSRSSW